MKVMRNLFAKLKEIPMIRNMLVLVSGTGIAQMFPILTAPIIARLYDPVHFGVYAVFTSIVTIFTGLASLEYNNVIIVAKEEIKAFDGCILAAIVTSLTALFYIFLILIVPDRLLLGFLGQDVVNYLWIVPITVFLNNLNLIIYTWFLRVGNYKLLTQNKIFVAGLGVFFQIGIGYFNYGVLGLVLANLLSISLSLFVLMILFFRNNSTFLVNIKYSRIKKLAIEYKNFPLISVWGNTLNIFTLQMPQFVLNNFFGAQVLGQYSLSQRMISLPLGFVSSAVQDVFRKEASNEQIDTGHCSSTYIRTLKILLIIGFFVLFSCLTFVPAVFGIIFGNKWLEAGIYVRVLSFLFVIRFIVAPLSYVFYIKEKQKMDFFWQIGLFILTGISLYFGFFYLDIKSPIKILLFYSIIISVWYLFNLFITYKLSRKINIVI
jgi:O-antigen/teichoic acid export membrane protein